MTQQAETRIFIVGLAALKKDLDEIKERLDGKTAVLFTKEATVGFRAYLAANRKPNTCLSYQRLLRDFEEVYAGRNIAKISAEELEGFLSARWGKSKRITLKQHLTLLKRFLNWCIGYTQFKGMPPFVNPCTFIEVNDVKPSELPKFIPIEKMQEFLATLKDERHWLMVAILLTAGLRVSELVGDPRAGKPGLKKKDVAGRILTIHKPKSGRDIESAVIPSLVEKRLMEYSKNFKAEDRIIPISYSSLYGVVRTHAKWVGLTLRPHDLRKWCATFWSRLQEYAMANFVLRHSETKAVDTILISSLGARYIAPPSPVEAMERQDKAMTPELFKNVSAC